MEYRISTDLGDGKPTLPSFIFTVDEGDGLGITDLADAVGDELCNDYGRAFGVGVIVTVERIA